MLSDEQAVLIRPQTALRQGMEHIVPHEAAQVGTMEITQHQYRRPPGHFIAQAHRIAHRITQRDIHRHLVAGMLMKGEVRQVGCGVRSNRQQQADQQRHEMARHGSPPDATGQSGMPCAATRASPHRSGCGRCHGVLSTQPTLFRRDSSCAVKRCRSAAGSDCNLGAG